MKTKAFICPQITVAFHPLQMQRLEDLVKEGRYRNKQEAVVDAVRQVFFKKEVTGHG